MDVRALAKRIQISASVFEQAEAGSQEANTAQRELRAASYELHLATTPPQDWLHGFPYVATELGAVRCLYDFGILNAIPEYGSITYRDLSSHVDLSQDVIERLCRFTRTFGFLKSSDVDSVEHSVTSRLALGHASGTGFNIQHISQAAYAMSEALRLDPDGREANASGFALSQSRRKDTHRVDKRLLPLWQILEQDQAMAASFAACMQFGNQSSQLGGGWVRDAFDWNQLQRGSTVVDVGGGRGHIMLHVAESFPHLTYIVQDRAEMIVKVNGGNGINGCENGWRPGTVSFMEHDVFTPQPVAADVFFFRKVFHDWSDAYAQQILRALSPALRPGARLIINDIVLPEPQGCPDYAEYVARRMDMVMMVMVNGKQRSLKEWQTLVCGAELRWQLVDCKMQEGSMNGVLIFAYA